MKLKLNVALFALLGGHLSAATLTDDFSGGLGSWSNTVILDVNGGANNTAAFQVNGTGGLELNTTSYDNIEQYAYIRSGATLDVGEEVQVDISLPHAGGRNLGLYVGGTAPTAGTRVDYITAYGQAGDGRVFSRGFDGTTEYNNPFADSTGGTTLFIARTNTNEFEVGFYDTSGRVVVTTRTPATANTADFVGLYADVRSAGTLGEVTEFRIIPEPSTVLLGALGLLSLARRRRS